MDETTAIIGAGAIVAVAMIGFGVWRVRAARRRRPRNLADALVQASAQFVRDVNVVREGVVAVHDNVRAGVRSSVEALAGWSETVKLDLRDRAAPDGTISLLFSDIEGSTALNELLGDVRWLDVLRSHNAIVRGAIRAHSGHEVKSQGDGFMVAFKSPRAAVDCSVAIQREIAARHVEPPILVRIGVHMGEAIRQDGDFFGRNVALAARVAQTASGGEILVSNVIKSQPDLADGIRFEPGPDVELKGFTGSWQLYRVAWQ